MNSQSSNASNQQAPSLPGADPRSSGREIKFLAATPICAAAPVEENKMTSNLRSASIGLMGLLVFGVVTETEATVISLYGDMDGFGQGIPMTDGINYVGNGGNFSDHRDAGDIANAPNTDSWEAGYPLSWTFNYVAPGATSAVLQFYIAGFADIGSVYLWVDSTFLTTYSFPPTNTTTHLLNIAVPLGAVDGSTTFSLLNGPSGDGRILDFAKLTINQVPEPSSAFLLALVSLGFGLIRRRRSA